MKLVTDNYLYNAIVFVVMNILLGAAVNLISKALGFNSSNTIVSGIVTAMLLGQSYALAYKKEMPKKLRLQTISAVVLIELAILTVLALFIYDLNLSTLMEDLGFEGSTVLLFLLFTMLATLMLAFPSYWLLGLGSRQTLKQIAKRKDNL